MQIAVLINSDGFVLLLQTEHEAYFTCPYCKNRKCSVHVHYFAVATCMYNDLFRDKLPGGSLSLEHGYCLYTRPLSMCKLSTYQAMYLEFLCLKLDKICNHWNMIGTISRNEFTFVTRDRFVLRISRHCCRCPNTSPRVRVRIVNERGCRVVQVNYIL